MKLTKELKDKINNLLKNLTPVQIDSLLKKYKTETKDSLDIGTIYKVSFNPGLSSKFKKNIQKSINSEYEGAGENYFAIYNIDLIVEEIKELRANKEDSKIIEALQNDAVEYIEI